MSTSRGKSYTWIIPVILLAIPVFYILSMGPMYLLAMRISSRPGPDVNWPKVVWHNAYMPVVFVARHDPGVRRMVSWYLSFCDPRPVPQHSGREGHAERSTGGRQCARPVV